MSAGGERAHGDQERSASSHEPQQRKQLKQAWDEPMRAKRGGSPVGLSEHVASGAGDGDGAVAVLGKSDGRVSARVDFHDPWEIGPEHLPAVCPAEEPGAAQLITIHAALTNEEELMAILKKGLGGSGAPAPDEARRQGRWRVRA